MNALGEMSEAGKTLGNTYEHLNATPGNPDNDPNYNSSPTYFLGLRKPLIAAINGAAAGLGFSYATFCGMRFMDRNAKIVTSFAPRGLIAEHGTCWMLPKLVGPGKAMELVLTSKMINSAEELDIGLINKRVADDELQVTAAEMASLIAGFPPMSVHLNKVGLKLDADMDTQFRHENMALNVLKKTEDAKEAASAFREKCTPVFTGR
jgi:enoyl-CoA hydratase/carnithine racemase